MKDLITSPWIIAVVGAAIPYAFRAIREFIFLKAKLLLPGRRIRHFRSWLVKKRKLGARKTSGFFPRTKFYERRIVNISRDRPDVHSPDKTPRPGSGRDLASTEKKKTPTYYYFVDKIPEEEGLRGARQKIKLQRFEAFLIPELDNGHSDRSLEDLRKLALSESRVSKNWRRYLSEVGVKVKESKDQESLESARRIIFFDKYLANLVLFDLEQLIKPIRPPDMDREASDSPTADRLAVMTYLAIQRARDLVSIHDALESSASVVETRYVDKARIHSNQYYDYGLYKFNGVEVVYQPIYRKGFGREVVSERVFIAENLAQQHQIKDFSKDFESVWNGSAYRTDGKVRSSNALVMAQETELGKEEKREKPPTWTFDQLRPPEESDYYSPKGLDVYSFDYFGRGYVRELRKALEKLED